VFVIAAVVGRGAGLLPPLQQVLLVAHAARAGNRGMAARRSRCCASFYGSEGVTIVAAGV
jgi:hypothetical protein